MRLVVRRGLLASALFLMLILQAGVFAGITPAFAAVSPSIVGEWIGTIEGDFRGIDDGAFGDFRRYAEITFTVDKDGIISGYGTGWEQYSSQTGCIQGSANNVEIEISGYVGSALRPSHGETEALIQFEVTPDQYPTVDCGGYPDSFKMHPFRAWDLFEIDLKDGTSIDSGAVHTLSGYPPAYGTDMLVIHGGGSSAECPALTITPTMPPASDPRNLAGPTDTASYRFQIAWEGTTPVSVNFDVEGGSGTISPSFVFNPANMQSSPISVLMDVTTTDAREGDYLLTVDAWVIDPDSGEECHAAAATVTLVVGESRAADLPLEKRVGEVDVIPEDTDAGGENVVIETGDDGAARFTAAGNQGSDDSVSVTTIDVGSNTAIKAYDRVDYIDKLLEDKAKTVAGREWTDNDLLKYKEPGAWEQVKTSVQEFLNDVSLKDQAFYSNLLSCLFALDADTMEICSGQSVVYVSEGDLHLARESATGEAIERVNEGIENRLIWDRLLGALGTPNTLVIPKGTEFTVNVQQSPGLSTTTVTLMEGSAIVVDLASEKVQLVNAGEAYSVDTTFAEAASSTYSMETVDQDSVTRWWQVADIEVGDYATSGDVEIGGDGSTPFGRRSVFSDNDPGVWAWIQFVNVYARAEHKIDFKWYAPDGSLYDSGDYTMIDAEYTEYWPTYGAFDLMGIRDLGAAEKLGQWKVDVYYDGDFVKEIPFYIAKNTLVKDQSVTYKLVVDVRSSNTEIKTTLENSLVQGLVGGFSGAENIERIDDIEWIKTTVLDATAEGELKSTLKLKEKDSIDGEPRSLSSAFLSSFIPTIGIDEELTIPANFGDAVEAFPSEVHRLENGHLKVGSSIIEAFQFSGRKELVEGDSFSNFAMAAHYEKHTGILVNSILLGSITSPEVGTIEIEFGVVATELSIPTTLAITSIPAEIQQNQDVSVSGTVSPPVSEGQVVLTYQRTDDGDEPIKRTVTVTDGAFSDSYKMEKDGTYAVSAQYLGSGVYTLSLASPETLTVTPSGCLIATAAFGSELTPQVQFLRNFRDSHILSTTAGSSFMAAFNAWYYSFSPSVADYEREQPWLQATVKTAIYPLLGILTVSEKAYSSMPGEYGALTAGIVASSMIGAVYFSPAAFAVQRFGRRGKNTVNTLTIVLAGLAVAAASVSLLVVNPAVLTMSTSLLVLVVAAISAIFSAKLVRYAMSRIARRS